MRTDKENLKEFRNNLEKDINSPKEDWVFRYDKISDILYLSPKDEKTSSESAMVPLGDNCLSIRISKKGFFEAVIIEDFLNMYVKENKEFEALAKVIKKVQGKSLFPFFRQKHANGLIDTQDYKLQYKSLLFDTGFNKMSLLSHLVPAAA